MVYDPLARAFLLRAKLGCRQELLAPVGRFLAGMLAIERFAEGCTLLVPVPSHPWITLRRGFSPAHELARGVARVVGLPMAARLLRRRWHSRLAAKRLTAHRRRILSRRAFRVTRQIAGERVLVVDDVMTTGATVEACARALKTAGALEVRCAVWARTLPGRGR